LDPGVYFYHEKLKRFPPAQMVYIIYRRLVEHGITPTYLWITDKILRRMKGFSPPHISQVQPGLYVGGQHIRRGLKSMRALGITAVVNLREESDDAARGVALDHYLRLPITDDAAPPLDVLERGSRFIAEQLSAGRGVYVHCASGVGRAPTLAAAYLVYKGKMPEEAWSIVREGRPFIRPTPPQIEIIREYARYLTKETQSGDG
jgi:protein-tyrosine phosphatase